MFVLTALWIIQQKTLKIACAAVFIAQNTVRMATYFLISIIYFQKETVIGITFQQRVVFSERHKKWRRAEDSNPWRLCASIDFKSITIDRSDSSPHNIDIIAMIFFTASGRYKIFSG
jgi:hypothetical protein